MKYTKYILLAILLIGLFIAGRWSMPDADLSVWKAEKKAILKREQNTRDSLFMVIKDKDTNITLLEMKDSVNIKIILSLNIRDQEQDRQLKKAYNELDKLGSKELVKTMIEEYEKYNN